MDFTIRPYTPADYDWVLQCEVELQEHERAIHDTRGPALPHTHDYLAMLWDELAEGQGIMLIAENAQGERLGLVAGHIEDTPWPMETQDSTRYGYVSDIYIKPEARGAVWRRHCSTPSRPSPRGRPDADPAAGQCARGQQDRPPLLRESRLHAI